MNDSEQMRYNAVLKTNAELQMRITDLAAQLRMRDAVLKAEQYVKTTPEPTVTTGRAAGMLYEPDPAHFEGEKQLSYDESFKKVLTGRHKERATEAGVETRIRRLADELRTEALTSSEVKPTIRDIDAFLNAIDTAVMWALRVAIYK